MILSMCRPIKWRIWLFWFILTDNVRFVGKVFWKGYRNYTNEIRLCKDDIVINYNYRGVLFTDFNIYLLMYYLYTQNKYFEMDKTII